MTEQEWLACVDPVAMMEHLTGKVSDRKWRLYLCGGCRQNTHLFFQPRSIAAVEIAERFADGNATLEELHRAEYDAEAATFGYEFEEEGWSYDSPAKMEVVPRLIEIGALPAFIRPGDEWQVDETTRHRLIAAAYLAEYCAFPRPSTNQPWWLRYTAKMDWPGRWLFDCVFGNPFWPIGIDPNWLAWRDGTIVKLAQAVYDNRSLPNGELDRGRLVELADALEQAGCATPEILEHLRSPGPHVRGCWAVDLLLGKE